MSNNESSVPVTPTWYPALIGWIRSAGGHVHESLVLAHQDGMRGIVSRRAISKGELLIRLPPECSLSGQDMPQTYSTSSSSSSSTTTTTSKNDDSKHASPWLRCLAALFQANNTPHSNYRVYLDSLPENYEHLFQWTDEHVDEHLKGTTLGSIVKLDRCERTLETRYTTSVRPYLEYVHVVSQDITTTQDEEHETFRRMCMCLSTRGFHLQTAFEEDDNLDEEDEYYSGPFLLPFVDLFNHNPAQSCTTLKRNDEHGGFYMIAERDIAKGTQVFHSYGNALTSAQVLQTFGFVPEDAICRAATWNKISGMSRDEKDGTVVTPAILSHDSIMEASRQMVDSGYAAGAQGFVKRNRPEEETWSVLSIRERVFPLVSNDLPVEYSDTPLSNELVTVCTLLLLPDEVYEDFMSDSPTLLDKSILQDYYLGKLVCRTLLLTIDNRKRMYMGDIRSDANKLRQLYLNSDKRTRSDLRSMYGLTIRIEEIACLEQLRIQVLEFMDSLDDDNGEP